MTSIESAKHQVGLLLSNFELVKIKERGQIVERKKKARGRDSKYTFTC